MSDLQTFGPLVMWSDVADATTLTLQKWMLTYLARTERAIQKSAGWLPLPGSYITSNDANHWPEDQPPAIVVAVPSTLSTPKMEGNRSYRAEWDVRVTVFVQAPDRDATQRLAGYYGATIRSLLLGKRSLEGFAAGTTWHGEYYQTRVADRDQRTLGSCENRFCVDVRDVVQAFGGPFDALPPGLPPDFPLATNVTVNLAPEALS
jgi:hypothetical protein